MGRSPILLYVSFIDAYLLVPGLIFSKRIVAALPTIKYALDNGEYGS
jgi:hypothetical protein